jgi:predicted phosphate transport protein (TIGR00153 family)
MRLSLKPTSTEFYPLFTRCADNLVAGAGLLSKLVYAEPAERADIAQLLKAAENDGDDATHQLLHRVNVSFITPFDRDDMYRLASCLDDVMDAMEEAGALVVLYRVDALPTGVLEQVRLLTAAAALTADAMPRLSRLSDLAPYWIEINRLESAADQAYRAMLTDLFDGSIDDPILLFKLKEIIDHLEGAADAFEKVAHTIESIAVKES